jgi:hypothetical protein
MIGYTASLDTFAMTRHTLDFNSIAPVDGTFIGLDASGAFAVDGDNDDGQPINGWIETGWTDFSEFNDNAQMNTSLEKRLQAIYVTGSGINQLDVNIRSAEYQNNITVHFSTLVSEATLANARAVTPRGLRARFFKFILKGYGTWKATGLQVVFEVLSRAR